MHDHGRRGLPRRRDMTTDVRESTAISRRTLMAAGAGLVLGTASLVLPGSMDEAAARGSQGGKMGGRHGKDHRGRDKHHDNHERRQRHQRTEKKRGIKDVQATFINDTFALMYFSYGDGTYYELGRDQRVTLTQSQSSLSVILKIYNPYYVFNAV